jgi:hypothetical protein
VLVVDASVLVVALADDGDDGDAARARLHGERLAAPDQNSSTSRLRPWYDGKYSGAVWTAGELFLALR